MQIYQKIKDMPNPSPGLLNFLKKNRGEFWVIKDTPRSKFDMRTSSLYFGSPTTLGEVKEDFKVGLVKGKVVARAFHGVPIRTKMFSGRSRTNGIMLYSDKHTMVNVTDKVVEALQLVGACAISEAHCSFTLVSPRIKECKFCGSRLKAKTRIIKKTEWVKA